MKCIFCKIANKEIESAIEYEDEKVIAFRDARPLAPAHILIIPRKHIASTNDLTESDEALIGHLIIVAKKIAADLQISEKGYKLLIRTGKHGGQEISHLHLHLIGGAQLHEDIKPV